PGHGNVQERGQGRSRAHSVFRFPAGDQRHHRGRCAGRFHGARHRHAAGAQRQGQGAGHHQPGAQRIAPRHSYHGQAGLPWLRSHFMERHSGARRHARSHHRAPESRAGRHYQQRSGAQAAGPAILHRRAVYPARSYRAYPERCRALECGDRTAGTVAGLTRGARPFQEPRHRYAVTGVAPSVSGVCRSLIPARPPCAVTSRTALPQARIHLVLSWAVPAGEPRMKVLIARLNHETNTFSPVPTPLAAFGENGPDYDGDAYRANHGQRTAMGAFIDLAQARGAEIVTPVSGWAYPSGPVAADAYDAMCARIVAAAPGCDAVLLDLHGAMVAEHCDDGEGDLLRRVREAAPGAPIGVALDLHGNVTQAMIDHADVI